jgi:hypothetical protein
MQAETSVSPAILFFDNSRLCNKTSQTAGTVRLPYIAVMPRARKKTNEFLIFAVFAAAPTTRGATHTIVQWILLSTYGLIAKRAEVGAGLLADSGWVGCVRPEKRLWWRERLRAAEGASRQLELQSPTDRVFHASNVIGSCFSNWRSA